MNIPDIDRVIAELRAGRTFRVPFGTTLFPETEAIESVLRAVDGSAFELTTTFREHAAGHGWSIAQHETEPRSEDEIRRSLAHAAPGDVLPR